MSPEVKAAYDRLRARSESLVLRNVSISHGDGLTMLRVSIYSITTTREQMLSEYGFCAFMHDGEISVLVAPDRVDAFIEVCDAYSAWLESRYYR